MFQIDSSNSVGTLPTPASAGTPGYFGNGTVVTGDWLNAVQSELMNLLNAAGVAQSKTVDTQVLLSLQKLFRGAPSRTIFAGGASGTFTVPGYFLRVTGISGGGAGGPGGGGPGANYVGGGGSGGGMADAWFAVTPGQVLTYSVGAGGNPFVSSGAGGATSVTGLISITGGTMGGSGSSGAVGGGATSGGTPTVTGPLGAAIEISGNGGQAGISVGGLLFGGAGGGARGTSVGTTNAVYANTTTSTGLPGVGWGDGGGGGFGTDAGGNGAAGFLMFET